MSDSTCFFMFLWGVCKGVCKGVYRGASRPGRDCYKMNVFMFSDVPFERLDRYLEDIVKFVFDRIFEKSFKTIHKTIHRRT